MQWATSLREYQIDQALLYYGCSPPGAKSLSFEIVLPPLRSADGFLRYKVLSPPPPYLRDTRSGPCAANERGFVSLSIARGGTLCLGMSASSLACRQPIQSQLRSIEAALDSHWPCELLFALTPPFERPLFLVLYCVCQRKGVGGVLRVIPAAGPVGEPYRIPPLFF